VPTYHQLLNKPRRRKVHTNNVTALVGCPQKKGVCVKLRIVKPKKPNSAQRKVTKLRLSTKRMIIARIPGQGHNLQEYSSVLVSGGRAPDLPGVRYTLIKGKYDFSRREDFVRRKKLSKYGYSTKES
jgi:small subunit ribosomal protein S12